MEQVRPTLSERFERSPGGQLAISIGIVLVLLSMIGTHLPPSSMERAVGKSANQMVRVLGSEQAWGVFAPNPRDTSLKLDAIVTFEDGTHAVWTVPEGPPIGANLRYYRWRKWLERARADEYRTLWEPTARWIASLYDSEGTPVVRVELVRRFHENVLEDEQPPYEDFTYYTLDLQAEAG